MGHINLKDEKNTVLKGKVNMFSIINNLLVGVNYNDLYKLT